jgi:hypothetical protein
MKRARFLGPGSKNGMRRWLYLVGCHSGKIKIGVSYSPDQRVRQHWKTFGADFAWYHLFAGYEPRSAFLLERQAIEALALIGKRIEKTECFTGIEKQAAMACVRALIAAQAVREDKWAVERIRNLVEFAERSAFSERRNVCWLKSPERADTAPAPAAEPAQAQG